MTGRRDLRNGSKPDEREHRQEGPELGAKQTQLAREQTSDSKRKDKDESKDQRDYLAFRDLKDNKDKGRDKDQGCERSR